MTDMRAWGRPLGAELSRIVVVSPHFDDAVLGCGQLLACHPGATVVTVFGGPPPSYPEQVTAWDAFGGFLDGDDVVAARREEDAAALGVLQADHVWLDFADHQYLSKAQRYDADAVAAALDEALAPLRPTAVFVPFGLANPDHALAHDAARLVVDRHPELTWLCYEDSGYKHIPGMLAWRVATLFKSGLWPTPAVVPVDQDVALKRKALACYASQLPELGADWGFDAELRTPAPEQFWRLAPPPAGWERLAEGV